MTKPETLTARLRFATSDLHRAAERAGIMRALPRGAIEPRAYCTLLRNLHALYSALERALELHSHTPEVAPARIPALYRTQALAADLRSLHGEHWEELPLTAAMRDYVAHVDALAEAHPALLPAHAYVRYMGDLSGGQILRKVVPRIFRRSDGGGTAFFAFGSGAESDAASLREAFRAALDRLPLDAAAIDAVVGEACAAFTRHIRLFEELDPTPAPG